MVKLDSVAKGKAGSKGIRVEAVSHLSKISGFLRHPSEITSRIERFTASLQAGSSARNYFYG